MGGPRRRIWGGVQEKKDYESSTAPLRQRVRASWKLDQKFSFVRDGERTRRKYFPICMQRKVYTHGPSAIIQNIIASRKMAFEYSNLDLILTT